MTMVFISSDKIKLEVMEVGRLMLFRIIYHTQKSPTLLSLLNSEATAVLVLAAIAVPAIAVPAVPVIVPNIKELLFTRSEPVTIATQPEHIRTGMEQRWWCPNEYLPKPS